MHSGIERDAKGGLLFPVESIGENFMGANAGESAFERVRTQLKARLGGEVYASWFARMKLEEASKDLVRLSVPTAFLRSWINSHYLDLVSELWRQELPQLLRVEVVVRSAATSARPVAVEAPATRQQPREPVVAAAPAPVAAQQAPKPVRAPEGASRNGVLGSPLDPKYTLETFVEGPSNRVALEIGAPDHAMRVAMLRQRLEAARAKDPSLNIGDEILEYVAATVTSSGRELEGAFNQLIFRQSFEPDITIERVEDLLRHMIRSNEPKRPRIEDIQRIVARHYNVSKTELLSNRRTRTIVKPRQIAMYLSKVMTPRSLPEIGRRFGGRDHTTVLHAVRKIEDLSEHDEKFAQELELLRRLISDNL